VGGPAYPPEHGWKTADRPITFSFGGSVGAEGRPGWVQFVEALGLNQLLDDPRFDKTGRNSTGLGPQATELRPEYERRFRDFPADHVVDKAREFKGTGAVFQRHEEVLSHPQTQALELVRTLPDGAGGERRVLAFPGRFSRSRPELRGGIAALGQHSREVAAEAGLPAERIEEIFRLHGLSEPGAGPIGKDH
jgi:crotonobetainyl-CoA:carnitine CoA-transferase CaiB-like acyl-CoA transferase